MTQHVLSVASAFYFFQRSELKSLMLYIFISFEMYFWSLCRQNGQKWKKLLEKNTSDLWCDSVLQTQKSWNKIKYRDIPFSPFFLLKRDEYYHHAQVDFDFGQVHMVWWLSYCQVEEKISVEPCDITWWVQISRKKFKHFSRTFSRIFTQFSRTFSVSFHACHNKEIQGNSTKSWICM